MAIYFCNNKEMEELFELQNCYNELKDNYLQVCKELTDLKQLTKELIDSEDLPAETGYKIVQNVLEKLRQAIKEK